MFAHTAPGSVDKLCPTGGVTRGEMCHFLQRQGKSSKLHLHSFKTGGVFFSSLLIIGIKEVIQKHFPSSITQQAKRCCKNGDCNKTIILKYSESCLYGKCDRTEPSLKIAAAIF